MQDRRQTGQRLGEAAANAFGPSAVHVKRRTDEAAQGRQEAHNSPSIPMVLDGDRRELVVEVHAGVVAVGRGTHHVEDHVVLRDTILIRLQTYPAVVSDPRRDQLNVVLVLRQALRDDVDLALQRARHEAEGRPEAQAVDRVADVVRHRVHLHETREHRGQHTEVLHRRHPRLRHPEVQVSCNLGNHRSALDAAAVDGLSALPAIVRALHLQHRNSGSDESFHLQWILKGLPERFPERPQLGLPRNSLLEGLLRQEPRLSLVVIRVHVHLVARHPGERDVHMDIHKLARGGRGVHAHVRLRVQRDKGTLKLQQQQRHLDYRHSASERRS
eukprot:scaffold7362_cov266-Pinguiococcus_pyrenoidosus.AAC.5